MNAEPEQLPRFDSAASRAQHDAIAGAVPPRDERAYAIGTPEHAALVALVKLNFPEIYEDLAEEAEYRGQPGGLLDMGRCVRFDSSAME